MAEDEDIKAARDAIGRRLGAQFAIERELPEQLRALLNELKRQDTNPARRS